MRTLTDRRGKPWTRLYGPLTSWKRHSKNASKRFTAMRSNRP
nr:MAG TPA: hypothetical protein [Caudoviricetes sp.]